jgi:hypothetical protein
MNTASRMESTGQRDRIQVSQDTADLLIASGKDQWLSKRKDKVHAKGKGELQTYWLALGGSRSESVASSGASSVGTEDVADTRSSHAAVDAEHAALASTKSSKPVVEKISVEKTERLIEWNVDVLHRLLKQIVARRRAEKGVSGYEEEYIGENSLEYNTSNPSGTTIDEVAEIITLPKFNAEAVSNQDDPDAVVLPAEVVDQLYDYVFNIAAM